MYFDILERNVITKSNKFNNIKNVNKFDYKIYKICLYAG